MLKLIVSDIDGTLITYGETELPRALFPLIHRLRTLGVTFCPASGRQFHSLRGLFAPVADELCYLCENGAVLFGPGSEEDAPLLGKTAMPRAEALALGEAIAACPGCEVLVSGQNTSYLCRCGEDYVSHMRDHKGNRVAIVERLADIREDIIKVSAYCPSGTQGFGAYFAPRWGEPFHMAAAGPDWLDFTLADKGTGLAQLCAALGVSPAETMAFGDNYNDLAMLRLAGTAYLMDSAAPELREQFPLQCRSVYEVLEALADSLERGDGA